MVFDELYLVDRIKDNLTEDMTVFQETNNNTEYEFDDCTVRVLGRVSQDYRYYNGGWHYPSTHELVSRTADFDSITLFYDNAVYDMTVEELYAIEKMLDI